MKKTKKYLLSTIIICAIELVAVLIAWVLIPSRTETLLAIAIIALTTHVALTILEIAMMLTAPKANIIIKTTYPNGELLDYYGPFTSVEDVKFKGDEKLIYLCEHPDGSYSTILKSVGTVHKLHYTNSVNLKDIEYE